MSYNLAIIIGRMTKAGELRTTHNGTSTCSFTVAVDRAFKNANGEKVTDFINCVAWRGQAEFISKYFTKGSVIGVQGNIQTRSYTDKEGNKRTATEILVDRAFFVGGKERNTSSSENASESEFDATDGESEDLPF